MDKVNLKWDTNIYYISHMKFSTSSCGKILAPLAYIKVVAVKFSKNFLVTKTVI